MDLNTLTLKELKKLRKDADKAIADFENRKKREALSELEKKAAEMGFSLSDLRGCKSQKTCGSKVSQSKRSCANVDRPWSYATLDESA